MPIDTRDKRAAAIFPLLPFRAPMAANPDGAWNQGDRQQAAHTYRGIAAGAPGGGPSYIVLERASHRRIGSRIHGRVN